MAKRLLAWIRDFRRKPREADPRQIEVQRARAKYEETQRRLASVSGDLLKRIKAGKYRIGELDPEAVRAAVFRKLAKEPGGKELIERLNKKLEAYWIETGQW